MDKMKNVDFSELLSEDSVGRLELFFANTTIGEEWKVKLKSIIGVRDDSEKVCIGMELFFSNTDLTGVQRKTLIDIIGV